MIIDKLQPFWTDEDRQKHKIYQKAQQEILEQNNSLLQAAREAETSGDIEKAQVIQRAFEQLWDKRHREIIAQESALSDELEERYFLSFNGNVAAILDDVREILDAIEKEDYLKFMDERRKSMSPVIKTKPSKDASPAQREGYDLAVGLCKEGNKTCSFFMQKIITLQMKALAFYESQEGRQQAIEAAEAKAAEFYPVKGKKKPPATSYPVERIEPFTPEHYYIANNKIMNDLVAKPVINAGAYDAVVIPGTHRQEEVTAYTIITYEGMEAVKEVFDRLTEEERQVANAIFSIWEEALKRQLPPIIYPEQVYKAMPGGGTKATSLQKEAIQETIEKFRHLHIYVDATEEFRKRRLIGQDEEQIFDDFFLSALHGVRAITKHGGKEIKDAYLIKSEPLILTYCKLIKQIITIPTKFLVIEKVQTFNGRKIKTGELLPMTTTRQAITGYIAMRIETMIHDKNNAKDKKRKYDKRHKKDEDYEERPWQYYCTLSHIISFKTLFNDVGLEGQTKQAAANYRDFVYTVLENWVLNERIKDYKPQKKGQQITGVEIVL